MGHHAQHPLHQLVHQRCTLRSQQIAQHQHNCSVQQHCTQTTGDECTKFSRHGLALRFAAEHKGAVGAVGKQDADDVIQHIAPAVGGCIAKQLVEQRIQHNVQQGAQHAENQIAQHFPVFLEKIYHSSSNPLRPLALLASTSPEGRGFIAGAASLPSFAKSSPLRGSCHRR